MNESTDQTSDQGDTARSVQYSVRPTLLTGIPRLIFFAAFSIAAMLVAIPVIVLVIAAVIVGAVIAVVLLILFALIRIPFAILGAMLRPRTDDGRRNVRVIVRN